MKLKLIEQQALIKQVKSNYKVMGEGKPLLILHGWGVGSSKTWKKIQKSISKKGYKVYVPDFPGFGKSGNPTYPWDVTNYMEWVAELAEYLKLGRFSIIAHSFGARVAIKYSANYPKKLEKLVLVGPAGIKIKPSFKIWLINFVAETTNSSKSLRPFRKLARKILFIILRKKDYVKAKGVMKEVMKRIIGEDLTPYFSKVKTKTLIVWGTKDKMVPVKYSSVFKDNIENSILEIMPKVGHCPHRDKPKKFLKLVIPFLKE
ncbi:MAG: alpha/beta hydrolase [Candidatus Nealsonbacteria bacterium]